MKILRIVFFATPFSVSAAFAGSVMAQSKSDFLLGAGTSSAAIGGGTSSSLPNAGTTEITYIIFTIGLALFVVGTLKLVLSYRS